MSELEKSRLAWKADHDTLDVPARVRLSFSDHTGIHINRTRDLVRAKGQEVEPNFSRKV